MSDKMSELKFHATRINGEAYVELFEGTSAIALIKTFKADEKDEWPIIYRKACKEADRLNEQLRSYKTEPTSKEIESRGSDPHLNLGLTGMDRPEFVKQTENHGDQPTPKSAEGDELTWQIEHNKLLAAKIKRDNERIKELRKELALKDEMIIGLRASEDQLILTIGQNDEIYNKQAEITNRMLKKLSASVASERTQEALLIIERALSNNGQGEG